MAGPVTQEENHKHRRCAYCGYEPARHTARWWLIDGVMGAYCTMSCVRRRLSQLLRSRNGARTWFRLDDLEWMHGSSTMNAPRA